MVLVGGGAKRSNQRTSPISIIPERRSVLVCGVVVVVVGLGTKLHQIVTHLSRIGAVGFVEEGPDLRFHGLPPGYGALEVILFKAKLSRQLLLRRFLRVQI